MKITALDIRQKTFERAFRGVDKDEVDAFLLMLSQQWERMSDENRDLRRQLDQAQHDVQKMREVESSLYRTLKTAEDTGSSIVEQAQKSAALQQREAQLQAEQLLSEARQKARAVVDEAYKQAEKAVADMQGEVNVLGQEHQRLESVLDTLVRDLQHLAAGVQEKVEKAQQRPRGSVAAILSRAASVKVNREEPASPATDTPMFVSSSAASSAAAVPAAAPDYITAPAAMEPDRSQPISPTPGRQPQPGEPSHPEISPREPYENPGVAEPAHVPNAPEPYVPAPAPEPYIPQPAPDIQPNNPPSPEIAPSPSPHPGLAVAPAEVESEKSFFDEI